MKFVTKWAYYADCDSCGHTDKVYAGLGRHAPDPCPSCGEVSAAGEGWWVYSGRRVLVGVWYNPFTWKIEMEIHDCIC